MAWTKSPKGLVDLFSLSLPDGPGLERRTMFGCPCAFANGNMFAGLLQDVTFVRLPPRLREALDAEFGVRHFEPTPGRPMRAYTVLPEEVVEDEDRYGEVLRAAYAFAAALPPRAKKERRPRKAAS